MYYTGVYEVEECLAGASRWDSRDFLGFLRLFQLLIALALFVMLFSILFLLPFFILLEFSFDSFTRFDLGELLLIDRRLIRRGEVFFECSWIFLLILSKTSLMLLSWSFCFCLSLSPRSGYRLILFLDFRSIIDQKLSSWYQFYLFLILQMSSNSLACLACLGDFSLRTAEQVIFFPEICLGARSRCFIVESGLEQLFKSGLYRKQQIGWHLAIPASSTVLLQPWSNIKEFSRHPSGRMRIALQASHLLAARDATVFHLLLPCLANIQRGSQFKYAHTYIIYQMFRELLGSDDAEENAPEKIQPKSNKPPVDPSLWKENKRGRKKKQVVAKEQKEKPNVEIPNLIKCLKHGTKDEVESNLEDFIGNVYQNEDKNQIQAFIPENDDGNIEYKLKLINPSDDRVDQLTTQMKFRLAEGFGEAYYRIGVEDNGRPTGLSKEDMFESLKTICKIAHRLKTDVIVLRMTQGIKGKVAELMVRKSNAQGVKLQIKVLMFGESGCGKSTLVGVLKSGQKDDGNGLARVKVFTHKNQILTGITQSVSHQVIGFDSNGNIVNKSMIASWESMLHESTKILTLIDVGGHKKAQKQVVSSLCSFFPEYAIMVISAEAPKLPPEQIQLATIFNIPIIIVITHIDKVSENELKEAILSTKLALKESESQKTASVVKTMEDAVLLSRIVATEAVTPIFPVSSVTGQNLDLFTAFLNLLPAVSDIRNNTEMNTQFLISDKFVIDGKIILAGTVIKGNIKTGQILNLGPDSKGVFRGVEITNVRCIRVPVMYAKCGQTCTLAIKPLNLCKEWLQAQPNGIRRGMVLVQSKIDPKAAYEFEAELTPFGTTQPIVITNKYQPVVNSLTTRQICRIVMLKPQMEKQQKIQSPKKSRSIGGRTTFKEGSLANSKTTKMLKSKNTFSFTQEQPNQTTNEKVVRKEQTKSPVLQQIAQQGTKRRKLKEEIVILPNKPISLRLRFKYYPEYITLGQKLIINEELLKAVGTITKIYY